MGNYKWAATTCLIVLYGAIIFGLMESVVSKKQDEIISLQAVAIERGYGSIMIENGDCVDSISLEKLSAPEVISLLLKVRELATDVS